MIMDHAVLSPAHGGTSRGAAHPGPALETWKLFLVLVLLSVAIAWSQQHFVLTRDVFHSLLGERVDAARIDAQFDSMQRHGAWKYLLAPAAVWFRLAMVALLAQLFALLLGTEISFRALFRAAAWALPALLYGEAIRIYAIARMDPSRIDQETLGFLPGSAAYFLDDRGEGWLYALLNTISLWQVIWAVAFFLALRATRRAGPLTVSVLVTCVWATGTLFQWTVSLLFLNLR